MYSLTAWQPEIWKLRSVLLNMSRLELKHIHFTQNEYYQLNANSPKAVLHKITILREFYFEQLSSQFICLNYSVWLSGGYV